MKTMTKERALELIEAVRGGQAVPHELLLIAIKTLGSIVTIS